MTLIARHIAHLAARLTALTTALVAALALAACAGTPSTPPAASVTLFALASGNPVLERNKANVIAFYDLMFNQSQPALAMRRYGSTTYTQHNPEVPDGREAFVAFFEQMARDHPGKRVVFHRVFAEGNFVTLHGEHFFPGWLGGRYAAIDIFRLDDEGRVVEHWDAIQKVPGRAANANGMF